MESTAERTSHETHRKLTDQRFVVDLLPDELVLAQRVAGFSCDGVNGSLLHLLLDGTVQHEQRLSSTLLVRGGGQTYIRVRTIQAVEMFLLEIQTF